MALHPALERLIQTKLAHTREPQWAIPIAAVRQAFRDLWTPALTGEPVSVSQIADMTFPGPGGRIQVRAYAPERDERPRIDFFSPRSLTRLNPTPRLEPFREA